MAHVEILYVHQGFKMQTLNLKPYKPFNLLEAQGLKMQTLNPKSYQPLTSWRLPVQLLRYLEQAPQLPGGGVGCAWDELEAYYWATVGSG